jgi:hypothetical protein
LVAAVETEKGLQRLMAESGGRTLSSWERNDPKRGGEASTGPPGGTGRVRDRTIQGIRIKSDATAKGKSLHGNGGRRSSTMDGLQNRDSP